MLERLLTTPRVFQIRLLLAVALVGCLVWLVLTFLVGLLLLPIMRWVKRARPPLFAGSG